MIKQWMGIALIVIVGLLMTLAMAYEPSEGDAWDMTIRTWHDDERAVTCWVASGSGKGGIACLPDDQVGKR